MAVKMTVGGGLDFVSRYSRRALRSPCLIFSISFDVSNNRLYYTKILNLVDMETYLGLASASWRKIATNFQHLMELNGLVS